MSIDTRLAEIQARCAAATKGPWTPMEYDHNPGDQGVPIIGGGERGSMAAHLTAYTMTLSNVDQSEADAEFIAHSRTDLPTLLAAVEAVMKRHRPVEVEPSETICAECSTLRGQGETARYFPFTEYPCPTVTRIQEALNGIA